MEANRVPSLAARPLPRGPHRLDHEAVLASQRERLIAAMAQVVAEKGYGETSVADVVSLAGVSRRTFYELFHNKEECFLAAYDTGVEIVMGRIFEALGDSPGADWREIVDRSLRAYVEAIAAEPHFARTFHLEVLAAGPAAIERRAQVLRGFAQRIRAVHDAARAADPSIPPASDDLLAALVGGINELVLERIRSQGAAAVADLHPTFLALATAVIGGRRAA